MKEKRFQNRTLEHTHIQRLETGQGNSKRDWELVREGKESKMEADPEAGRRKRFQEEGVNAGCRNES